MECFTHACQCVVLQTFPCMQSGSLNKAAESTCHSWLAALMMNLFFVWFGQVSNVDPGTPQEDAKKALVERIDTYIQVPSHIFALGIPMLYMYPACSIFIAYLWINPLLNAKTPIHWQWSMKAALNGFRMMRMQEKIVFADDMLVKNAVAKVDDGDIILTYGYSSIVFSIFVQAQKVGITFLTECCSYAPFASCKLVLCLLTRATA